MDAMPLLDDNKPAAKGVFSAIAIGLQANAANSKIIQDEPKSAGLCVEGDEDELKLRHASCSEILKFLGLAIYTDGIEERRLKFSNRLICESPVVHTSYHRMPLPGWIIEELRRDENSDNEIVIFERTLTRYAQKASQTEAVRRLQRISGAKKQSDRNSQRLAPCEMTKQTLLIEALGYPTPTTLSRAPLMDRFCYILADFASALYCSFAIMCCCSPSF